MSVALTDTELERVAEAMVAKHLSFPRVVFNKEDMDEHIRTIVQTTVVDTYLILSGALAVEDYERE